MVCVWLITVDPEGSPEVPRVGVLSESADGITMLVCPSSGEELILTIPLTGEVNSVSVQTEPRRRW
jgi:hypothetical protein